MSSFSSRASRRAQLQRALGDTGEVLPRIARGDTEHPAAGWYAKLPDGDHYLGDHTGVAFVTISRIIQELDPE